MVDYEERAALKGMEKKLFQLMVKGATKAQWAEWLRAPLEHALVQGDKKLALTLLAAGADGGAGWEGCDGRTLLGAAAEGGSHEVVSAILKAGGSEELDAVSGDGGMTPIHHAIAGGHTEAARMLMLAGADVALLDDRHRSALHYAVEGGHVRFAENAVIGGADPDAEDVDGDTPLHLAAAHDDQAFVGVLLRRGASVGATNEKGRHPLYVAIEHGHIGVAETLLEAGADPNVFDHGRYSPLYLARRSLAMTRSLLKHGADVEVTNSFGYTALHFAGGSGTADVVEALVEAGADVEAKSGSVKYTVRGRFEGLTPLHTAALRFNLDGMSALLRQGAAVNATERKGQTPLHVLCKICANLGDEHTTKAADLLLRWGADEMLTDKRGRTPEQLVKQARATSRLRRVLANAPADRVWRRRGMLIMYRAFLDKMKTPATGGKGRAGKAKARRGRGRGGGSAGAGCGRDDVLTRVVELEDDAVFRTIVGFL